MVLMVPLIVIVVSALLLMRYRDLPELTPLTAVRYLLMCLVLLLVSLVQVQDQMAEWFRYVTLGASPLFAAALVIVVWDSVGYEHKTKRN